MQINLNEVLNQAHTKVFRSTDRRLLFYGSKGSGKSYTIADKILLQPSLQSELAKKEIKLKIVVIRQSMPSLKRSCIELLQERAEFLQIPYKLNKSDFVATFCNGSRIIFIGLDDSRSHQKLQSVTNVDMVWIEELPEIKEKVYENADLILRGGNGLYKQLIGTFNPVSTASWIYNRWWEQELEPIRKEFAFVEDNKFIDQEYIETLRNLKNTNPSLYKVYYLGEWGRLEGVIYDNYEIVDCAPVNFDEMFYGLDFGFNNKTALVRIYLKDKTAYIEELFYESGWTNTRLIKFLKNIDLNTSDPIYCDIELDRIQELCDAGFNALPADKNVEVGIDFCKALDLKFLKDSYNLKSEAEGYCWAKDKDGNNTDKPVKFNDHLMDAMRYGLYTHLKKYIDVNIRTI